MPEKAKWSLRDVVYQEAKFHGCNKQILRAALEDVLPVSREVTAKRKAQKQAMHDLAGSIKDLKNLVDEKFEGLQGQTAQASQNGEVAALMLELKEMRDQWAENLEKQKAHFVQASAHLNQEIKSQMHALDAERAALTRDLELFKQLKLSDAQNTKKVDLCTRASDDVVKIEVGTELFHIPSAKVIEKKGFLHEVFFGALKESCGEDGIFRWRDPCVSSADFTYVAQYYTGNLPSVIAEDTAARLHPLVAYLGLDAMAVLLKSRSQPVEPDWEIEFTSHHISYGQRAEPAQAPQGRGWKPFASTVAMDSYGETHSTSWRRQKPWAPQ